MLQRTSCHSTAVYRYRTCYCCAEYIMPLPVLCRGHHATTTHYCADIHLGFLRGPLNRKTLLPPSGVVTPTAFPHAPWPSKSSQPPSRTTSIGMGVRGPSSGPPPASRVPLSTSMPCSTVGRQALVSRVASSKLGRPQMASMWRNYKG